MSVPGFVNTNILVYADDRANPAKRERAQDLISEVVRERSGRLSLQEHYANFPVQKDRGAARSVRVRGDGESPVAVLWVRSSEANRSSKCLEDTRSELARKGLTHRRMSNDSPKIKWSCQRVNEQVGVGIPRQFSGRDGLLDQL